MFKYLLLFLLTISNAYTNVLAPNDIVFVVPSIEGDDLKTDIKNLEKPKIDDVLKDSGIKETEGGFVISIPIKNENGEYEVVEIEYSEEDGNRTITIPGHGDITVGKDENGDYNIELTPDQIKNADNVTCNVGIDGKGTCTIKPFVKMVGSNIITADQLVVGYQDGQNLKIIGGEATNLKITDKFGSTDVNKSETSMGDSVVQVSFGKQGSSSSGTEIENLLNAPDDFKNSDFFEVSLNTSTMVRTVTNPNNHSQTATQFKVKNGAGINSSIVMSNGNQSNINIAMATKDGIYFNPDPFSETSTTLDTNAPIQMNMSLSSEENNNQASLSLVMSDKSNTGEPSELILIKPKQSGGESKLTSTGATGINISQATIIGSDNKIDPNSPIAFEIISNNLTLEDTEKSGAKTIIDINGVQASGNLSSSEKKLNLSANKIDAKISKDKLGAQGNIKYVLLENNDVKKQSGLTDYAYYNNGVLSGNLAGDVFIDMTEYKNQNQAIEIDGKKAQRVSLLMGDSLTIESNGDEAKFTGGVTAQEVSYFDKTRSLTFQGRDGVLKNKDYNVSLNDEYFVKSNFSPDGKLTNTFVYADKVNTTNKKNDDSISIYNTQNYYSKIYDPEKKKELINVNHNSDKIEYVSGNKKNQAKANDLSFAMIDEGEIRAGSLSFSEGEFTKSKGKIDESIKITGLSAAYYSDVSDSQNKSSVLDAQAKNIKLLGADYSVDIKALNDDGEEEAFKIVFLEQGNNKLYKIYAEDGSLVHISGDQKGKDLPQSVFKSIEYFESPEFKQIVANELRTEIKTVDAKNDSVRVFSAARVNGLKSINGNFTQLHVIDGKIEQIDNKNNSSMILSIGELFTQEEKTPDSTSRIVSANNLSVERSNTNQNTSFGADTMLVNEIVNTDGSFARAISISNASSKLLTDNKNQTLNSDSIQINETQDAAGNNSRFVRVDGINLNDKNNGKELNITVDSVINQSTENADGQKTQEVLVSNLNGSEVASNSNTKVKNVNGYLNDNGSVLTASLSAEEISRSENIQSDGSFADAIAINSINAVYVQDETDPENKSQTLAANLGKVDFKNPDLNISMTAKNAAGIETNYSVFLYEKGNEKYYKIYSEDGELIHISGQDNKGRIPEAVFKSIEYYETDEFKQSIVTDVKGKLTYANEDDDTVQAFSIAKAQTYETTDGTLKQYLVENGSLRQDREDVSSVATTDNLFYQEEGASKFLQVDNISLFEESSEGSKIGNSDKDTQTQISIESVMAGENITDDKKNQSVSINEANAFHKKGMGSSSDEFFVNGANLIATKEDKILTANISVESIQQNKMFNDEVLESIAIQDIDVVFVKNDSDSENQSLSALGNFGKTTYIDKSIQLSVIGKDKNGNDQRYAAFVNEVGDQRYVKVFSEEGDLVYITGEDNKGNIPNVLFKSFEAFEQPGFSQAVFTSLEGEMKKTDTNDPTYQKFNVSHLEANEFSNTPNLNIKQLIANDASILHRDDKAQGELSIKSSQITETVDTSDFFRKIKTTQVNLEDLKVNYIDLDGVAAENAKRARFSMGSLNAVTVENVFDPKDENKLQVVTASNIDFIALDPKKMQEFNLNVGQANYFYGKTDDNEFTTTLNITDVKDGNFTDKLQGHIAEFGAEKIIRVVTTDENGKETGSYFLVSEGFLNYKNDKDKLKADIKVGVLEYMNDVVLEADMSGKILYNPGKPFGGQVNFALKGKNLVQETNNYTSEDGAIRKVGFKVEALEADGRLDLIELSAGPNIIKDAFSISAKGSKEGGRSLEGEVSLDKRAGKGYLKVKFKDGDEVKIKLLPFKWVSEKTAEGAEIDQEITFKGQYLLNNMNIVTELLSEQELTEHLGISPGGALIVKSNSGEGWGLELIYKDKENLKLVHEPDFTGRPTEAKSFGIGLVKTNAQGDETSGGILLSGDSEVDVKTHKGHFEVFGFKMDDHARIPATVNLYFKKKYADGDGFYTGVFYDTTSAMVDPDILSSNAEYYEGGRTTGGVGASLAYFKKLSPHSNLTLSFGANNNFENKAVCLQYKSNGFEPITELAGGVMNVLNGQSFYTPKPKPIKRKRRTVAQIQEVDQLEDEIDQIEIKYQGSRLYETLTRSLKAAQDYLADGKEMKNYDVKALESALDDLRKFSKLEENAGYDLTLDGLISRVEEKRVIENPNMSEQDKLNWKMIHLTESVEKLSKKYSQTKSFDVYLSYLDNYKRLKQLGVVAKPIKTLK